MLDKKKTKKSFEFSIFHPFLASIANTCIYLSYSLFFFFSYFMLEKWEVNTLETSLCRLLSVQHAMMHSARLRCDAMQCNDAYVWQMCPSVSQQCLLYHYAQNVKSARMSVQFFHLHCLLFFFFNSVWMEKLYLVRKPVRKALKL